MKFGLGAGIEPGCTRSSSARLPLVEVRGMTETGRIYADSISRARSTRGAGRPRGGLARVADDRSGVPRTEGEPPSLWGGRKVRGTDSFRLPQNLQATKRRGVAAGFTPATSRAGCRRMLVFVNVRRTSSPLRREHRRRRGRRAAGARGRRPDAVPRGRQPARGRSDGLRGDDAGVSRDGPAERPCGGARRSPTTKAGVGPLTTRFRPRAQGPKAQIFPRTDARRPGAIDLRALKKRQ